MSRRKQSKPQHINSDEPASTENGKFEATETLFVILCSCTVGYMFYFHTWMMKFGVSGFTTLDVEVMWVYKISKSTKKLIYASNSLQMRWNFGDCLSRQFHKLSCFILFINLFCCCWLSVKLICLHFYDLRSMVFNEFFLFILFTSVESATACFLTFLR